MNLKLPSFQQWKKFFSVLNLKEKSLFLFFCLLVLGSLFYLGHSFYITHTEVKPAHGGTYKEGIVGQPRFINPIYAPLNDPDRDLVGLIFSGLMQYDQKGNVVLGLAKDYSVKQQGKVYQFTLRKNAYWHDGQPVTAEDVVFTIDTIKNPDYDSPHRGNWLNVEVEELTPHKLKFVLGAPDISFLETLAKTKIVPKHIWKDTPSKSFSLAISSTQFLIGSGPYKFESLDIHQHQQIKVLKLKANPDYYISEKPYLSQVHFLFFNKTEELVNAYLKGQIDSFPLDNFEYLSELQGQPRKKIDAPRYFSIFFNPQQSDILTQKGVREALSYGTNRQQIVQQVLHQQGQPIYSPVLPQFYNFPPPENPRAYNLQKANQILDNLGYKKIEGKPYRRKTIQPVSSEFTMDLEQGDQNQEVKALQQCLSNNFPNLYPSQQVTGYFGRKTEQGVIKFQEKFYEDILEPWGFTQGTGLVSETTRKKLNEVCAEKTQTHYLEITLTTVDNEQLIDVANLIKKQWKKLGVKLKIDVKPTAVLENKVINPRNYETLLFGEILNMHPDLYPFWHSSKKDRPGLNLALYQNDQADSLLEETHQTSDYQTIKQNYTELQDIILEDVPAVFLYRPFCLHFTSDKIHGDEIQKIADPARRFCNIENWYIYTNRVWK